MARSKSAALCWGANRDYRYRGTCISKVVGVGSGCSPVRSQQQQPFDRRQVVVGKQQKSLSERRWMASLLLYREYAKAEIGQQPAPVG